MVANDALDQAVAPTPQDAEMAKDLLRRLGRQLASDESLPVRIQSEHAAGDALCIPPGAVRLLLNVLQEMAQGKTVTVMPIEAELSTQQAAALLNVSRPFLIKLLDNEQIRYRRVGRHRRIRFEDLQRYKETAERESFRAMAELQAEAQRLDMGY